LPVVPAHGSGLDIYWLLVKQEVEPGVVSNNRRLRGLLTDEEGQGLVEYALILVLVAIVVIGVLSLMGAQINNAFQDVVNTLKG
jgi:pilus assembly protein Flp/PilA